MIRPLALVVRVRPIARGLMDAGDCPKDQVSKNAWETARHGRHDYPEPPQTSGRYVESLGKSADDPGKNPIILGAPYTRLHIRV